MKPVLIDSNVLIDIFTSNEQWFEWSRNQLTLLSGRTRLFINPVVYSEISIGFQKIEEVEDSLSRLPIEYKEIPREALFLAGKAFLTYRRAGGRRSSPLPDFYVGAHGAVEDWRVITRDPGRMTYYFPRLEVLSP